MIDALITGVSAQTRIVKKDINIVTNIILKKLGKYFVIIVTNIIIIVILNQLTAIKWVNHELLKLVFKSLGKFSLAHNKIHCKKIHSLIG